MPRRAPMRAHLPLLAGISLTLGLAPGQPPGLLQGAGSAPDPGSALAPGLALPALDLLPARDLLPALDPLPTGDFVVAGVRLFDGARAYDRVDVIVREGRIAGVVQPADPGGGAHGTDLADGLPRVEGAGRTLLPLLVDAHVHTFDPGSLEQALAFGVGIQLDMFAPPEFLAGLRQGQGAGGATGRADVLGAGFLATASGGHGTQFGLPVPTVDAPGAAAGWVEARVEEGADWVKIVLEPGSLFGMDRPTLDDATLRALVEAAHAHGLLAVVHVSLVDDALRAVRAGADGLVHLWGDRVPTGAEIREMAESGLFIVPTLVVQEGMVPDAPEGWSAATLLDDTAALLHLDAPAREALDQRFTLPRPLAWSVYEASIQALREAGVPLLTGSDAPNPGTVYGASVHRELELLVAAGLTPKEALAGATSLAARHFRLNGRPSASHSGVIEVGAPAHLLLVEGDPTTRIADTRRIAGVWKEGIPFDWEAHATRVAQAVEEAARMAAEGAPSIPPFEGPTLPVGTFDQGTLASPVGVGWSGSTDALSGGRSTATLEVVEGGADGTPHALRVKGSVNPGLPFAWSGAFYQAGAIPFTPVDASAADGIQLALRIEEGEHLQISVFSRATGTMPVGRFFEAGALAEEASADGWVRLRLRWEDFPGMEPDGFIALLVAAGPPPGPFDFLLDEVAFFRDPPEGGPE